MVSKSCRFCHHPLSQTFCDLGSTPLANALLDPASKPAKEPFFPLHAFVCEQCWLVQLPEHCSPQMIFSDYAYFSSYSSSWLEHCKAFVEEITERFNLTSQSLALEIASNDGYLLQYLKEKKIPILGIEPAKNVAALARKKGIPTRSDFFSRQLAKQLATEGIYADLIIANNVLAHVPDLNDFISAVHMILKPEGVASIEFPHLLQLIQHNQFDTIYHEHFSYFTLIALQKIFETHALAIFDVEELATHGGSLRLFISHKNSTSHTPTVAIDHLIEKEQRANLHKREGYIDFQSHAEKVRKDFKHFLTEAEQSSKTVVGYGAAAKGNTLLNFCNITSKQIPFTADLSPHKQGKLLPGTHISIVDPSYIFKIKPDYIVIFPWNIKNEIMKQLAPVRTWGCKFVVPIPSLKIY